MENSVVNLCIRLLETELFSGFSEDEVNLILCGAEYKIEQYTKKDVFAIAGNQVSHLMIVLKGCLIARMESNTGKQIQIDRIEKGRIVAPAMLFATENLYPVNVFPDGDTSVFFMHKNVFLKIMSNNEKLLFNFMRIISDINRFLSSKIYSLSLKTIRGKLAEYLLLLQEKQNASNSDVVKLNLTRQELADKFAISRQALSRSLSELESQKMISICGRNVKLLDKKRLLKEE